VGAATLPGWEELQLLAARIRLEEGAHERSTPPLAIAEAYAVDA
jgi:hypothetical protein